MTRPNKWENKIQPPETNICNNLPSEFSKSHLRGPWSRSWCSLPSNRRQFVMTSASAAASAERWGHWWRACGWCWQPSWPSVTSVSTDLVNHTHSVIFIIILSSWTNVRTNCNRGSKYKYSILFALCIIACLTFTIYVNYDFSCSMTKHWKKS